MFVHRDSRAYALLNDQEQRGGEGVVDALTNYDIRPVVWSAREQVREELGQLIIIGVIDSCLEESCASFSGKGSVSRSCVVRRSRRGAAAQRAVEARA